MRDAQMQRARLQAMDEARHMPATAPVALDLIRHLPRVTWTTAPGDALTQLIQHGAYAHGALLSVDSESWETDGSEGGFDCRRTEVYDGWYGWRDGAGQVRLCAVGEVRISGCLNADLRVMLEGSRFSRFIVAYDPESTAHALFFEGRLVGGSPHDACMKELASLRKDGCLATIVRLKPLLIEVEHARFGSVKVEQAPRGMWLLTGSDFTHRCMDLGLGAVPAYGAKAGAVDVLRALALGTLVVRDGSLQPRFVMPPRDRAEQMKVRSALRPGAPPPSDDDD